MWTSFTAPEKQMFRIATDDTQSTIGYAYKAEDARLFAAAPDLLAVLEEIARDYITPPRLADIARAAIAKAKGGKL